jgi:hypothetical protein
MHIFNDWIVILLLNIILDIFGLVGSFMLMIETPTYLLSQKKYEELNLTLMKISNYNNCYESDVKIKLEEIEKLKSNIIDKEKVKSIRNSIDSRSSLFLGISSIKNKFNEYSKIFKDSSIRSHILLLSPQYITVCFIYYSIFLYLENIPGDAKTNSFLIYFSYILAAASTGYVLSNYSRKKCFFVCEIIILLACLLLQIFKFNQIIISFLILTIFYCINILFAVNGTYVSELFDSSIKTTVLGIMNLISNLSLLFTNPVLGLFKSKYLLYSFLTVLSIIAGVNLPETKI